MIAIVAVPELFFETPKDPSSDHKPRKTAHRLSASDIVPYKRRAEKPINHAKEGRTMTVSRTVRITGTEMKETINQFEQDLRSNGTRKAVRSLISEALLIWMDALEQASAENDGPCRVSVTRTECSLDKDAVIRITVGMGEMLSIRDAFLISAIVDEQRASREFLMDFAERPKHPGNAQRLEQLLSDAFRDPSARPDMKRCDQAVNMLFDIIDMIPKPYRAQPFAVISYIMWWMGREGAIAAAISALAIDDQCSLAAIVCSAVERHIGPAWTSET